MRRTLRTVNEKRTKCRSNSPCMLFSVYAGLCGFTNGFSNRNLSLSSLRKWLLKVFITASNT